jgi:hypothetical protein
MFAVVRERAANSGMREDKAEEFRRFRAKQPGYQGTIEIPTEDGRTMLVALWETAGHAQAASKALEPEGRRLNGPEWSGPPRIVAQGDVAYDDLTTA